MAALRRVPAREGVGEHEDRGSRFRCYVFPAPDEAALRARLEELRREHPKARHHCWAWRGGEDLYRFSDDGEPGGTAGRPMLQVLAGAGLVEAGAVCIRWFGGVKLGTGGLVRAYTAATRRAVTAAGVRDVEERVRRKLSLPFDRLGLRRELERACPGLRWLEDTYGEEGWVGVAELPAASLPAWEGLLREAGLEP